MKNIISFARFLMIIFLAFFSSVFFWTLVYLDKVMEKKISLWSRVAISHLVIIIVVSSILIIMPGGLRAWGINIRDWRKSLLLGLFSGLSIGILFSLFSYGTNICRWNLMKLMTSIRSKENIVQLLTQLFLVGTSEELFFRGLLVTYLMRKYSKKLLGIHSGIIIISAMCGLLQFYKLLFGATLGNISALAVGGFVYSIWLGLIYQKTGSLFGPILAHNLGNSLMVLGGLGV